MKQYVIKEIAERHCLECGDELVGRTDKKFCSFECKNRYNNLRSHKLRATKNSVNSILERNYDILTHLLNMGMTSLDLVSLTRMGFNPAYNTSSTRAGCHAELWCYDIRYCLSDSRLFKLERRLLP